MIEALPGSQLFQHLYAIDQGGRELDTVCDGDSSCALMVSWILHGFGWIDAPHVTVESTLRAMRENGWSETNTPRPGDVILWPMSESGHRHLGFFLSDDHVISNVAAKRAPGKHGLTMLDGRKPQTFYARNYDE